MKQVWAIIAVIAATAGQAAAAPSTLDRSQLSVDENVVINTICGAALSQGGGAYEGCLTAQLDALKAHPSPDRSQLSAEQNRIVEKNCDYMRRVGIADWNECLKKAMTKLAQVPNPAASDELQPDIATAFTTAKPEKAPQVAALPAQLPRPQEILPKRPVRVERAALSPAELYKSVEKSVFVVLASPSLADVKARNVAQGSAVAVSESLLLTNCHVVQGRPLIKIMQDRVAADATLVAEDVAADRCVIKATGLKLTPVSGVGGFDQLAVGERAFAIGAPRSLERTLSEGLVSGLRHQRGRNLVQTSAAVSPGSSGGGLFDERGNLIGITTLASLYGAQNLNFAVAASDFWE